MHPLSREFIQHMLHPGGPAPAAVPTPAPQADPRAAIAQILHPGPSTAAPAGPVLAPPMR